MQLRIDHIAGTAFVVLAIAILWISGDLPFGQLSMPGSGFLPRIVAWLMGIFGVALVLRARESEPLAKLSWSDAPHALTVIAVTSLAIGLYTTLGFIITMFLMMAALLIGIERRNPLRAGVYGLATVLGAYVAFTYFLKTPMPVGPFGF